MASQTEYLIKGHSQEPILKFHNVSGITRPLWRNERISSFDAFGFLTCVGTSLGRVHVFDGEVRPEFIVSGGQDGRIVIWEWKVGKKEQYGDSLPGAAGDICGLAISPGFPLKSGVLYFSISNGAVVRRMRTLFGFADHSIMSEVDLRVLEGFENVLLDDAFDVDIPESSGTSPPKVMTRENPTLSNSLYYHAPFLVCQGNLGVHIFSEQSNRVIASFSCLSDGDSKQQLLDSEWQCSVVDGELVIRIGRSIYICRYSEDGLPSVTKAFEATDSVLAVTIVERHLVLIFSSEKSTLGTELELGGVLSPGISRHKGYSFSIAGAVPRGEVKVGVHTKSGVVLPLSMTVPKPVRSGLPISGVLDVVEEGEEKGEGEVSRHEEEEDEEKTPEKKEEEKIARDLPVLAVYSMETCEYVDSFFLHISEREELLFPFIFRSSAPFTQSRYHVTSQTQPYPVEVYMVGPQSVFGIRALKNGERVRWFVENNEYSKALFVCERHRQKEEQLEVADRFGAFLWKEGQHSRAVQVWAEYILPHAPVDYWRRLCSRLGDEVYLMDSYLPFDNPKVLPESVYLDVLVHFLQEHDYRGFYERISRWPVCYRADDLETAILNELESDAAQNSFEPSKSNLPESGRRAVSVIASKNNNMKHTQHRERSRARYLYLSLFKLFEFQNRAVDALRVLLKVKSPSVVEYFRAHDGAAFFNLASEGNHIRQNSDSTIMKTPQSPLAKLSSKSVRNTLSLSEKRKVLSELLEFDSMSVIEVLVEDRAKVGVADICTLLQSQHEFRLSYLRAISAADPSALLSFHSDVVAAYLRVLTMKDRKKEISEDELEKYRLELLDLLRDSDSYDVERVMEACEVYSVEGALEIVKEKATRA